MRLGEAEAAEAPPLALAPAPAPAPASAQAEAEAEAKALYEVKIKALANKLANDQILRLKSRTSGRNVILQLAQDLTAEADRLVQPILDERMDLQFKLSNLNNVDIKVGGAVDVYDSENSKLKTCMSTRKASAIEQYDKELEDLQKQKKELMTTKTFEVQKQQQGQKGQQNFESMNKEQLIAKKTEFTLKKAELEKRPRTPNIEGEIKGIQRRIELINGFLSKKTGGQRRVTMRQPRQPKRFHGY